MQFLLSKITQKKKNKTQTQQNKMCLSYIENKEGNQELEQLAPGSELLGFEGPTTSFKPIGSRLWVF